MGSTESQGERSKLDCEYRLIRRYISDLYAGSEVTVVQHKQTKQHYILRQFIQQLNPEKLTCDLQTHRSLTHRNLIQLQRYWIQNDINICSSLFKVYAIFEYHEATLEEWINNSKEDEPTDRDVADFARQIYTALGFLQRNKISYLLAGPKSIAIVPEDHKEQEEKTELNKGLTHRRSASKILEQTKDYHRKSLVEINRQSYLTNPKENSYTRTALKCESSTLPSKRTYKIFHPIEGTCSGRSLHNLTNYLQVPPHPQLISSSDYMLSDSMVHQQNLLTVGLIVLSICEGCEVAELDIFKYGRLSIQKFMERVGDLKQHYPRTAKEVIKAFESPFSLQQPLRISQGLKIKDVPMIRRQRESKTAYNEEQKQNIGLRLHEGSGKAKASDRQISGTGLGRASSKRLSLLQM